MYILSIAQARGLLYLIFSILPIPSFLFSRVDKIIQVRRMFCNI